MNNFIMNEPEGESNGLGCMPRKVEGIPIFFLIFGVEYSGTKWVVAYMVILYSTPFFSYYDYLKMVEGRRFGITYKSCVTPEVDE